MTSKKNLKSALESMMFVWGQPLDAKTAADVCNSSKQEVYACFKELQEEYEQEGRGIRIREVNGAFQFATPEESAFARRSRPSVCRSRRWRCWRSSRTSSR